MYCRRSLSGDLLYVFLMIRLRWWVLGKIPEGRPHLHPIRAKASTVTSIVLYHLAEVGVVEFVHCAVTCPPPFHYVLLGRKSVHSWLLRSEKLGPTAWRGDRLHKLFFWMGVLVFSPHFINWSIWTHGYLLYTLSCNAVQFNFFLLWPLGLFQLVPCAPFTDLCQFFFFEV